MNKVSKILLVIVLAGCFFMSSCGDSSKGKIIHAQIDIKDYGVIKLELDGTVAPITVDNFVELAEKGLYDGTEFHRIMPGFMIQGGDTKGRGLGDDIKNIKGEFSLNGVENNISHVRGVISMARNGIDMNSASDQFFIVHKDSTGLDGSYAAFGHVTEGMEIIDKICEDTPVEDNDGAVLEENRPVINSIRIVD